MSKKILTLDNVPVINKKIGKIDTIEKLKASTIYSLGDVVEVLGFHTKGDGSHHKRVAKSENDGSGEQGQNGIWWCIVHNGEVNVSWFGAVGDRITDDTESVQRAIDFCNNKVVLTLSKMYKVDTISISAPYSEIKGIKDNAWRDLSDFDIGFTFTNPNVGLHLREGAHSCRFEYIVFTSLYLSNTIILSDDGTQGIKLTKCKITKSKANGYGLWLTKTRSGESMQIHDTEISNCGIGIYRDNGDNVRNARISKTNIHRNKIAGIKFEHGSTNLSIVDNCDFTLNPIAIDYDGFSYGDFNINDSHFENNNTILKLSETNTSTCVVCTSGNTFQESETAFVLHKNSIMRSTGDVYRIITNCFDFFDNSTASVDYLSFFSISGYVANDFSRLSVRATEKNSYKFIAKSADIQSSVKKVCKLFLNDSLSSAYIRRKEIVESIKVTVVNGTKTTGSIAIDIYSNSVSNLLRPSSVFTDSETQTFYPNGNNFSASVFYGNFGVVVTGNSITENFDLIIDVVTTINESNTKYPVTSTIEYIDTFNYRSLDTPYYAYKMQEQGIYEDYVTYRDELHEYENSQVADETMLLPVLHEPEIPESVKAFAEKYKLI